MEAKWRAQGADLGWEGRRPSIPNLPQPEVLKIDYMLPKLIHQLLFSQKRGEETNWKYPASQSPNSSAAPPVEVAPPSLSRSSVVAARRWRAS